MPARYLTPAAIEDLLEQELPDGLKSDLETLLVALVGDRRTDDRNA
ncbi:MAG: hypothetical protein WD076_10205 [Parvularculaceae bacterium]